MAVISTLWMVFGYSIAFGEGNAFFGNPNNSSCSMASVARQY